MPGVISQISTAIWRRLKLISYIYLFFFNFYLFMIVTQRERERGRDTGRGRSRLHAPGFDPRSPGSRPGPKSGAKPLRHPGIPPILFKQKNSTIQTALLCTLLFPPHLFYLGNNILSVHRQLLCFY